MPTKEGNIGSKDGRARSWTFLVYPDSAPENWRDILDTNVCIPWVESPLHDPDGLSPDPDEHRKKHWHVELMYDGLKSYNQVLEVTKKLNATVPKVIHNLRSLTRYFLHLDQPSKQQFELNKIVAHCGADIKDYLINKSDKYFYVKEMCQYVLDNEITEFHDLVSSAMQFHQEWFECLCDNSSFIMNLFIKSYRHDPRRSQLQIEDSQVDGKCIEIQ